MTGVGLIPRRRDWPSDVLRSCRLASVSAVALRRFVICSFLAVAAGCGEPPRIVSFASSKAFVEIDGEEIELAWETAGAEAVYLEPGGQAVAPSGTASRAFHGAATVRLVAVNAVASVERSITIADRRPTLSGVVLDVNGVPVSAARVVASGAQPTVTDPDGGFTLVGVSPPYTLTAASADGRTASSLVGISTQNPTIRLYQPATGIESRVSGYATGLIPGRQYVVAFQGSERTEHATLEPSGTFSLSVLVNPGRSRGRIIVYSALPEGSLAPTSFESFGASATLQWTGTEPKEEVIVAVAPIQTVAVALETPPGASSASMDLVAPDLVAIALGTYPIGATSPSLPVPVLPQGESVGAFVRYSEAGPGKYVSRVVPIDPSSPIEPTRGAIPQPSAPGMGEVVGPGQRLEWTNSSVPCKVTASTAGADPMSAHVFTSEGWVSTDLLASVLEPSSGATLVWSIDCFDAAGSTDEIASESGFRKAYSGAPGRSSSEARTFTWK